MSRSRVNMIYINVGRTKKKKKKSINYFIYHVPSKVRARTTHARSHSRWTDSCLLVISVITRKLTGQAEVTLLSVYRKKKKKNKVKRKILVL